MKIKFLFVIFYFLLFASHAQLKYVVEDFEGLADGTSDLKQNGIFTYGNMKAGIQKNETEKNYSGKRNIKIFHSGKEKYGGWGKGIGMNIELDANADYLNFYFSSNDTCTLQIELQEDDNADAAFENTMDDSWAFTQKISNAQWQLISIQLNHFKDANNAGNGTFDVSYRKGKLFAIVFNFPNETSQSFTAGFDFINFSRGKLPQGNELFSAPAALPTDFCALGAWNKEGNQAKFSEIPSAFEKIFSSEKKIGVAHFFQPFAFDGGTEQNLYPSLERINKVIEEGYIPLITLEDHFANLKPGMKQPNLYSIVEGHFDSFFNEWAKQIKQVKGIVLLRILHEFNGDWYPWCIANNDKKPELFVNAFRHIRNIFYAQDARNVKFIWCPNSMSIPQENWNFILDAYPGNEWVDFVALDIYNGAGKASTWRSFRKEGIENYFLLTQNFMDKPLLVCEAASRERKEFEEGQTKAEWIEQMSDALSTDMNKVRLLCWFNENKMVAGENKSFRVNSSAGAQNAFLNFVMKKNYFKPGTGSLAQMLGIKMEVAGKK